METGSVCFTIFVTDVFIINKSVRLEKYNQSNIRGFPKSFQQNKDQVLAEVKV